MRIKVKEDTENTEVKKEIIEIKKEGTRTPADDLFDHLQSLVLEYLGDKCYLDNDKNHLSHVKDFDDDKKQIDVSKSQSQPISYKFQPRLTLLNNLIFLYVTQIANNLLWHIDVDETLEFAASNQECLLIPVEIKDPHGQRIRGTPLQIVAAAGDRNPRELKPGEKDYGLVERLRPCFPKDSHEYDKQLEEWFRPDSKKEHTNKTMAPYVRAIKTLCQEIITSTEISDSVPFETLLMLPMAEKFRKALNPDPNHVVTSGSLFDLQIFPFLWKVWEANTTTIEGKKGPLGYIESIKSSLFSAIAYPALQARVQRIDLEIFKKGSNGVLDEGHLPDPINFSKGIPADFAGLGISFFFSTSGKAKNVVGNHLHRLGDVAAGLGNIRKLVSSKNSSLPGARNRS